MWKLGTELLFTYIWKDFSSGIQYSRTLLQRNIFLIVFYIKFLWNKKQGVENKSKFLLRPYKYEIVRFTTPIVHQNSTTIWRIRIAWWIPKSVNTHSEYVILLFHYNGSMYAPQCCVVRKLSVLLTFVVNELSRSNIVFSKQNHAVHELTCVFVPTFSDSHFKVP